MTWIGGEGGWAGSVLQLTLRSLSAPFSSSSQTNIGTVHVHTIHSELDHGYCSNAVVPCTPLTACHFYPSSRSLVFCLYLISVNESSFGILSRGSYSSESVPNPPLRGAPQTHISAFNSDISPRPSLCPMSRPSRSAELTPTSGLWPHDSLCLETVSSPVFLHGLFFIVN